MTTNHNLDTFSTLFLVKGILNALLCLIPLIYIFFGTFMFGAMENMQDENELPFNPGIFIMVIGLIFFILLLSLMIVTFLASKYLKERKNHTFIFIVAILNCFTGILGILLGVFTIIELEKPHVKALLKNKGVSPDESVH